VRNAIIGWDIGGAHVKAAALDADGRVRQVLQLPCPLWQGMEFLDRSIRLVLQKLGKADLHAITMTGEMVDLFESRDEGVMSILEALLEYCPPDRIRVFAGGRGFVPYEEAQSYTHEIASANWQATAASVARIVPEGLLVDIGSTTTDVIALKEGKPFIRGRLDSERLYTNELVYCGVVRTPLMALTRQVDFRGYSLGVMAEHFATLADVYRILGTLPETADQQETADGGPKTVEASYRRIARMIGMDAGDATGADWVDLARHFAQIHQNLTQAACERVRSECHIAPGAPLVGAGVGRFLLPAMAAQMGCSMLDFALCVGCENEPWVSECAPAVSVARLALAP
jgi:probable H4MPT-linked C1 transfer pathway protein